MKSFLIISKDNLLLAMIGSAVIGVGFSYSDLYLFHVLFGIYLIFQIYQMKKNLFKVKLNFINDNNALFLLFMILWYALTALWVEDLFLALKYIFYIACGIAISLSIVHFSYKQTNLDKIFRFLGIFFIIELFIALLESFTNFRMPISSYSNIAPFFGKDPVDFFVSDNILFYSDFTPPTGFHWNTNDLAIAMNIILPFFLCSKKIYLKFFGIICVSTIIIMTASRAVFLGLILIYCLYLIIIKKKIVTLFLVWVITLGLFLGLIQSRESENPRINELANSIEALSLYLKGDVDIGGSLEWRRELVDNGLEAFTKTYGLGLGAGGSTANQEKIGAVAGRFTSMHNFWIEILVEGGIIFACIIFFWYSNIIYRLFLISRSTINSNLIYYSKSLLLSMIAFIPSAVAASSTIYFFPMWIMFGFSIAVINLNRQKKKLPIKSQHHSDSFKISKKFLPA